MSNEYYDHVGTPPTGSQLSSALIRAEFAKVESAFDKMPQMSTGANKLLAINGTGTGWVATDAPDINGGTIDGAQIGLLTPSTGSFTTLTSSGATALGATTAASINSTPIGATTASTGRFTSLTATGATLLAALSATSLDSTPIGSVTPSTGAFTSLTSTSGAFNGTVGATTPSTGAFTSLTSTSGAINGTVGATTPSTGAFTTLNVGTSISGSAFTAYFASPPAIGGTAAAAITGTTITASTQFSGPGTGITGTASSLTAGTATNATNTGITEDVVTAVSVYPTWVTANSGNLPQKTTSTKLSFVPSTGILSATGFSGPINGTIGATTPAAGTFTTLSASSTATAPTVAVDTNSTAIATTAYVIGQASATNPLMNGAASIGSSTRWSRQDHVHPTDTTRAPIASPTFTGSVTLPGDPASALQAATKQYVDNAATGIDNHASVAVATTAAITLSGLQTIDGYTTLASDRVLVKNQASLPTNGVYIAAAGAWTRATDWDGAGEVKQGSYVFVNNGTTQGKTGWTQQTSGTITIGTTDQVFQQFSAANNYSAGTGLQLVGNTFSVTTVPAANGGTGITSYTVGDILYASTTSALSALADVATGNVLISGGVNTAPSYGKVGLTTHVSGTLAVGNGGTGVATLTGIVKGNGASAFTAATAGTDYSAGTSALATGILKSTTSTGALSIAAAGTDYQAPIGTISGIVKGNGANALAAATASDITTAIGSTAVTNATNATNTGITEDVATAVAVYPTWVTANTGNLPQKTTSTRLSFVPSTGALSATSFSGAGTGLTGTASSLTAGAATNATNTGITEDTATAVAVYPTWVTANSGNLPQKTTSTKLSFVPSTGVLSATSFSGAGTGLTGTASSLTVGAATNATNLTGSGTVSATATGGAGLTPTNATNATNLTGSGTVSATTTGGAGLTPTNATNTTNTGITEDTTTAVAIYPTWVTANSGNLPQKTTSTKLSFIPSTGVLTATSFSGAGTGLTGTAASLTAGAATSAGTATNWGSYGGVPTAGSVPGANGIPRADASGYTFFNYINSNTGNSENPSISQVITTNGTDNFYRKASIAHLTSAVQSNASGSWGISVTGSAGSAGSATNATNATNLTGSGTISSTTTATTQTAGTNNTTIATTAFVATAVSSGGSVKAWARFDASSGTPTITDSFNVSSITDTATGQYAVNFTTALADAKYAVTASLSPNYGSGPFAAPQMFATVPSSIQPVEAAPSTSSFSFYSASTAGTPVDVKYVSVAVFR